MSILLVGPALAGPEFADRTGDITHQYTGGWEHFVGGGLAAFDCDGDHLPELYAAGGDSPAVLLRNTTEGPGAPLRFQPDTSPALALSGVIGAYPFDIDSDGLLDLAVLRVGPNVLLKGGADCSFSPFADLGTDFGDHWTTAFSATWEPGQSLPTLAFGNYVDRKDPEGPFGTCDASFLYRPEGAAYGAPLALTPGYCTLSMLFSDWGRQGRADLRVSNDRHYYISDGQEQMWHMSPVPRLYSETEGWQPYQIWGMGIASRDISGDGLPEVYLTSMGDQKLQSLVPEGGGPRYRDATYDRGTTAHRPHTGDDGRPSTGWHVAFGDVENDGDDDIFVSKGNVEQMPGSAMKDPNTLLLQQPDGTFVEESAAAGVASMVRSRGAVLNDLNGDGLLDLAVVNRRAPIEIYQNVTEGAGHWLSVALVQEGVNPNAIGAWIELEFGGRVRAREVVVGGGHAGGSALPEHFGLGPVQDARLRVIWPDGQASDWQDVGLDRRLRVARDGARLAVRDY